MSETESEESGPITMVHQHVKLDYKVHAGHEQSKFLKQIAQRRIVGQRSAEGLVYVPPIGVCPTTGEKMEGHVEVSDKGTITTFCIVNLPFEGQQIDPPYALSAILLDGADLPIFHLIGDVDVRDVHMGMRVQAKWRPEEEAVRSMENIIYFVPSGEPDADYDSYKEHL
jgi:uncharacterized OB-fold protein